MTGLAVLQPVLPGLAEATAEPRRYGLHGTLKAPFVPRYGLQSFLQAATSFAAQCHSFALPALAVKEIEAVVALCPVTASPQLYQLAEACVKILDPHRTPESEDVQAKRRNGKTARQIVHITQFGYPFIFEDFNFHMTLTGQMKNNPYLKAACAYFSQALGQPRFIDNLAIFVEEEKGSPFRLYCRLPFAS